MRSIYVQSTDPMFNLALEEWLFANLDTHDAGYFLLWHNAPCIIVGRHQNTFQEINTSLVDAYNLPVVRRMTGGGAVYHDLGNVNFSFIRPLQAGEHGHIDFATFLNPMVDALQRLGINAVFSSRNDLTVGEKKISGSAQLRRAGKVLHHGTLLVHLDLDMLGAVLTGAPDKYLSKGISSVRSRVTNISELLSQSISPETHMHTIKETLMQYIAPEQMSTTPAMEAGARKLMQEKYNTHAWNYGASPAFTELKKERFSFGLVECHINVHKGIISEVKIFGDFFAQRPVEELEKCFQGASYTSEGIGKALKDVQLAEYFSGCDEEDMRRFFCTF